MKKILIVSHALELGGVEKSLIGLLDAIDKKKYEIDLFLMRHEGELYKKVPEQVNLLKEIPEYTVLEHPMKQTISEGHVLLTAARVYGKIRAYVYMKKHHHGSDSGVPIEYSHKYTCCFMPRIEPDVKYDLAISFLTPHYAVLEKVNAKKKIAWIHTDYSKIQVDIESERDMWKKYDKIVSISEAVTYGFLKKFPELESKIVLIENILPEKYIQKEKKAFTVENEMPERGVKFLSIGRYCKAKNFDNIPEICRKLLDKGINIYWYIIGYGTDEKLIKDKIKQFGMSQRVILLGKKQNPYPYIEKCDYYIQPSRYEGKSVAVREAQMLGKPVIITNYTTAKSQVEDGVDGVIVPLEKTKCAEEIYRFITDRNKVNCIVQQENKRDYSNVEEVEKLYEII